LYNLYNLYKNFKHMNHLMIRGAITRKFMRVGFILKNTHLGVVDFQKSSKTLFSPFTKHHPSISYFKKRYR